MHAEREAGFTEVSYWASLQSEGIATCQLNQMGVTNSCGGKQIIGITIAHTCIFAP